ncbi:uncharacterized protein LOC136033114 isoform X2 [Artemia franciscana]|uniref:SMP domain-containing protein n=2 Tax=Artemia franciscana TaxID=6661 RepID=A0AA88LMD0_ARTSF|nr:hypothetical protein QYM36_008274 [Artemia franciscana]
MGNVLYGLYMGVPRNGKNKADRMEESQSTEYPKSYDPLKGDSQSTEQEAFQLKANEEYRGTFPQGEAGMDTKQQNFEDVTPAAAAEFEVEKKGNLQPSAFSGRVAAEKNVMTPAMMQPQSEMSSKSKEFSQPSFKQSVNVDQPDERQFESKVLDKENKSPQQRSQYFVSPGPGPDVLDTEARSGFSNVMQDTPEGLTRYIDADKLDFKPKGPGTQLPMAARPYGSDEIIARTQGPPKVDEKAKSETEISPEQQLEEQESSKRGRTRKLGATFPPSKTEDKIPDEYLDTINRDVASEIQSIEARQIGEGGVTQKGGVGAQARAAAARNEPLPPLPGGRRRSRKYSNTLELTSGQEDIGQAVHITVDLDKVTREEAAALQSIEAKFHGGVVPRGSLAAAAQAAAALNGTPSPPVSAVSTPQRRRSSVGSNNAPGLQQLPPGYQPIAQVGNKGQTVHPNACGLHVEQVSDNSLLIECNFDRITREDAAFIQALEAKLYGGVVPRGSLAAQAQAAAARNEPIPGQQPLQQSPPPGFSQRPQGSRRSSVTGRQQSWQGPDRVAEDVGHLHIEANLNDLTREEAAVLQSVEAQMHQGIIPKGSVGAVAQSASMRNEPLLGQPLRQQQQDAPSGASRRKSSFNGRGQQFVQSRSLTPGKVAEDVGNIHLEADLSDMTRQEAAVLQSAEAQLHQGIIPKGSVGAAAQSAAVRNEPSFGGRGTRTVQQGQQPFFAPAVNITPGKVAEDVGNVHIEADLSNMTRHEAAVLQSAEAQLHQGIIPKGSVGAAAQSAAVRNEPFVGGPGTRNVQQQGQQPLIAPAVTVAPGKVAEDVGNVHLEADLSSITRQEANILQSVEAQLHQGIIPKESVGAKARSAAVRNEPFFEQPGAVQRSQAPRQSMQESGRQTRSTAPGGQQQFAPAINVTPGKVVEDVGNIHLEADLRDMTRREAAVLQSAEAQLHQGIIPKGSVGAAAQSAAVRNEPFFEQPGAVQRSQASQRSTRGAGRQTSAAAAGRQKQFSPAINVSPGKVVEDVGNVHLEADLNNMTRHEAAALQSAEAQLHQGIIPKGSVGAAAQSAANRNEPPVARGRNFAQSVESPRSDSESIRSQEKLQGRQVEERIGNTKIGADLDKVTRHEASVLQSAEAQLSPSGTIPKRSVASAAQSAVNQSEPGYVNAAPQVVLEPVKPAELDENTWTAKQDIGNIHVEADLKNVSGHEASVLQSLEAQREGVNPQGGLASLSMSSVAQRERAENQERISHERGSVPQRPFSQQTVNLQQEQQQDKQPSGSPGKQEIASQTFTRSDEEQKNLEPLEQRPGRQINVDKRRSD